ncbi:hypothetical protein BDV24DRAFT_127005 [Aspergillus arachidicola]|uniref:Uncharacterized protein n=1 Tax=Aspergillus arachidicola TaxID=656916 RepID=A0A5N6YMG2_9EURO|nr:hypothetical protein BDV24DRAFT_127005 [Aspergillus arachidicola]
MNHTPQQTNLGYRLMLMGFYFRPSGMDSAVTSATQADLFSYFLFYFYLIGFGASPRGGKRDPNGLLILV